MFPTTCILCVLILVLALSITTHGQKDNTAYLDRRYHALSFGETAGDYVMFKPNMQPVKQALTVCSWVKRARSDGQPTWFSYATNTHSNEIRISDDGYYNHIHNNGLNLQSKLSVDVGSWYHICLSWATASSGTKRVYYNGELAGSDTTSSSELELGGTIVLGYLQRTPGGGAKYTYEIFGGQLYKLNVFSKELTAAEVKEMSDGGLCSEVEEKYGLTRYLKWEDILLLERNGNVTEVDAGCHKTEEEGTKEAEKKTECDCSGKQNTTATSRWDVLRLEGFYNKTLTHDILNQLRTGWDILEDFVGATVNDGFIRHFKFFHDGKTCDE